MAAAVKWVAKRLLEGSSGGKQKDENVTRTSEYQSRHRLLVPEGIGKDQIVRFLQSVPGISSMVVAQQLANLKSSGHYARLIEEVKTELEQEHEAVKRIVKACLSGGDFRSYGLKSQQACENSQA